ncbi:hypothetical protein D3C72_1604150 [compost metagenome]
MAQEPGGGERMAGVVQGALLHRRWRAGREKGEGCSYPSVCGPGMDGGLRGIKAGGAIRSMPRFPPDRCRKHLPLATVQPTKAFSSTKWPGALILPSMKPRASSRPRTSLSISGLPHSMTRSFSVENEGTSSRSNSSPDSISSVMRPRVWKSSRVTVGK